MSLLLAAGGGSGVAYSLTANAGSYSLTGGTASLKLARTLTANAGSYSLSGGSAALSFGHKLTANAGSYSLSGGAASLKVGKKITALAGSYSLVGGSAVLTKAAGATAYTLTALAGSYVINGGAATLAWSGERSGGGGYDEKKKKYVVRKGQKLLVFTDKAQAIAALGTKKPKVQEVVDVPETVKEVPLQAAKTMAAVQGRIEQYNSAYNSRHWEQLLRLFQEMQDEDDVEALLMSL